MNPFIRASVVLFPTAILSIAVQGASGPVLSSKLTANAQVEVSWTGENFSIEKTLSLVAPVSWQPVSQAPVQQGNLFTLILPADEAAQFLRLTGSEAVYVFETSPADAESGVAVTRETVLRFSGPLGTNSVLDIGRFHAFFGSRRLLTRGELSSDRRTATLFYLENLPAAARIEAFLDGTGLAGDDGNETDLDQDGIPGGTFAIRFETAGTSPLPNTGVMGHVYASERNANGTDHPLESVIVTVDGAEQTLRAVTDASGFFRLSPAPGGRVFVHVDGRTAVEGHWPGGAYYPFVGKAWEIIPGNTNNLAGGTGVIYLPLVPAEALQPVSVTEPTVINFPAAVVATNPALAGVTVTVPANALFSETGVRGGKVGIAAVPADRLPAPLPVGLNLPIVITIQTDGPQNFDQPVPVRFPNLPDPVTGEKLPPGAKTVLWSFNHDTGRWEPQGSATISADGNFAESDPGVGARQPGWHGVAAGSPVVLPPRPPLPSECQGDDCPKCVQTVFCTVVNKPGKHYALCALSCIGDAISEVFGNGKKPNRTAFETGLRCIGGPDKCPQKPEDTLTQQQRDCMDQCRFPDTGKNVYVVPCEGFFNPCKENLPQALRAADISQQATENLLPDRFEEQIRFWEVEGEFLIRLTGTPKIIQNSSADVPKLTAFFDAFSDRVHSDTPAGIHLSAEERAELAALPRPAQFSLAEWAAMIDRLDSLQGSPLPADVASAEQALDSLVTLLKQRGWKYRMDGLIHGSIRLSRARAPAFGSEAFPGRAHYYYLKHHQSDLIQRGRVTSAGHFQEMVLSPGGIYTVLYYDPVTRRAGAAFFQAANSGFPTVIPTAPLESFPPEEADSDGDGLLDTVEEIIGTNPGLADSDGDGIPDGDEIDSGSNPLDGTPQSLGAVAGIDTPGSAVDVYAWNDLAAVADSEAGVALFNVSNPLSPVLLSQIDTPGRAIGVAGSGSLLAVADDTAGVALINTSDPALPALIAEVRLDQSVRAVAFIDGKVVAGLNSGKLVLLSDRGEILQQTQADGKAVQDLLSLNGALYSLKFDSVEAFTIINGGILTNVGTAVSPGHGGAVTGRRQRLSGGGNRLLAIHRQGYNIFDISAPLVPLPLQEVLTAQFGWKHIVPDGSGLALAAVDATSTESGPNDVSLYSIGPNSTGTNFVATFSTPGVAGALSIYKGVALVADSLSGLTVVNYRARNFDTNPPSVTIRGQFKQSGQPAEGGAPFGALADAADDHMVREVEFYLNDQLAAVDGNYPFEAELRAPQSTQTQPQFTLRARAFDMAGNSTWSDVLVIDLSKDLTPPTLLAVRPLTDEHFQIGDSVPISARFDEAILPATLDNGFRLINLGTDGLPGTPDDSQVSASITAISPSEYALSLTAPLPRGTYAARVGTNVTDIAGNPVSTEVTWQFQVRSLIEFIGTTNFNWNASKTTSNNWSFGHIPTIDDFVHIAAPNGAEINASQVVGAFELTSDTPLNFASGSTLQIGAWALFNGPVVIRSGAWQGGNITFRGPAQIPQTMTETDQDWTNEGHLTVGPGGSINFRNSFGYTTTLRNLAGATWETVNSQMGVFNTSSGPHLFVNEGLFIARGTNKNFIGSSRFVNLGSVEVREGILEIKAGDANNGPSQHLGSYRVDAGATLNFTGLSEFGRASRIFGPGNVTIANTLFPGSYEIDGATTVSGPVTFSGPVRTHGPWTMSGGHPIFAGLNPEVTGPVVVEGAMTVSALPEMRLNDLTIYRDFTVTTALEVDGPLRLDSTTTPSGAIASARLLGAGRIRANGPLTFAGIVNGAGQGTLEIAGMASGKLSTIVQFGPSGYRIQILSNGVFDISGIQRISPRGRMTNEGSILKTDSGTTLLTVPALNSGQIQVTAGVLAIQNGSIVQTAGTITLGGGEITVAASGSVADTSVTLLGGKLEGAGKLTCASVTNRAEINPGLPIGILDLEVGDHPVYSLYQQLPPGKVIIDLAGTEAGTGYDQLKISGRAILDGDLELRPTANFDPPLGQEFVILTCAKREGTFSAVTGNALVNAKRLEVVYEDTQVKVRVVAP